MRATHTFVELEVSREAYLEIYTLLANAGYHHAFIDGAIDMHGIALTKGKSREGREPQVGDVIGGKYLLVEKLSKDRER